MNRERGWVAGMAVRGRLALQLLVWLAGTLALSPHQGSTSFLSAWVEENQIHGRWDVPLSDLDLALRLDADGDKKVSGEEMHKRFAEGQAYAFKYLRLKLDGQPAPI